MRKNELGEYCESDEELNDIKTISPSDILRMSLATGFFFNSARKVHNSENTYLLLYPEGNVVDVD